MQQQQIKKVEESKSNEKKGSKPKADLGITNIVIHTDKARSPSDFSSDVILIFLKLFVKTNQY